MIIVQAGSEVVPFSKTGGLGDVLGALPRALGERNHTVIIVSPLYRSVLDRFKPEKTSLSFPVRLNDETLQADVYSLKINDRVTSYFIAQDSLFLRDGLYVDRDGVDYTDNAKRFIFLSRAVLELFRLLDIRPDVIHCHDWQTGLVPAYMRTLYRDSFGSIPSVFTIHNIGYQGTFWHFDMPLTGMGWEYFTSDHLEFFGKISLLKAGIVFADAVTTVSPTYSREILDPEFGYGMEGVLKTRQSDLFGILNGVDYSAWSPQNDTFIPNRYDTGTLELKRDNKIVLNRMFNLNDNKAPVIGMITRLAQQKGIDLVVDAAARIMSLGFQLVLLGSGDKRYENRMKEIANRYRGRIGLKIGFDNSLAHLIEAGSDLFLMPSIYEPCGLNQMYSLRYGTVPVVRSTGGLNDTIIEYDPASGKGNGFKFSGKTADDMLPAIKKALDIFHDQPQWENLSRQCMRYDYSWDRSARSYDLLYQAYTIKSRLHGYAGGNTDGDGSTDT